MLRAPCSRQRVIEQVEQQLALLSTTRPVPARRQPAAVAVDTGLVPLTDEQDALVKDSLARDGSRGQVLVSGTFKGAHCRICGWTVLRARC